MTGVCVCDHTSFIGGGGSQAQCGTFQSTSIFCNVHRIVSLIWASRNSGGGLFRTFWNSDLGFTDQNVLEQWVQ